MRSFAFLAAPLLASVALAQDDGQHTTVGPTRLLGHIQTLA